jgi:hypothetical protein
MYEQYKIDEGRHFLSKLAASVEKPQEFAFELSAFLSAARSALQYVLKEAKTKQGGQAWYDGKVNTIPELKFFKDKRDLNIHVEPVVLNRDMSATETICVSINEAVSLKIMDQDGNVIEERTTVSSPLPSPPPNPASAPISSRYRFSDWSGHEDVETLCSRYLMAIEDLVKDGCTQGFLTG